MRGHGEGLPAPVVLPTSGSASCPGPQVLLSLCGRCFDISCSAGHFTSWWLDHRHPHSRFLSATRSTSVPVCKLQESSAYASPICWRSEPQRRALCFHGRVDFLICSREPARWRPMSSWHVPEPGAPTSGQRQLLPTSYRPARPSVRPCIGRSTSRRSSTIPQVRSQPRPKTPLRSQTLWDLAQQGFPTTPRPGSRPSLARQRSRVQLTWLALHQHVFGLSRNSRVVHACEACGALTCPCAFTRSTRSLARGSGRCSKGSSTIFPRLALCSTIFATEN